MAVNVEFATGKRRGPYRRGVMVFPAMTELGGMTEYGRGVDLLGLCRAVQALAAQMLLNEMRSRDAGRRASLVDMVKAFHAIEGKLAESAPSLARDISPAPASPDDDAAPFRLSEFKPRSPG